MDDPICCGHPINLSIWPHLCGICRSPNAKKCAGCKSFAFCGKDHQRKSWYRHKRVCKFLKEIQSEETKKELGGEFDGPIGLKKKLLLWKVFQEMNPDGGESDEKKVRRNIEKNQMMHFPICLGCGKLPPLSIVCQCRAVAFCSSECEDRCKNGDGTLSDRKPKHPLSTCHKFQETTKALPILKEHGWSPGSVSSVGKKVDLVQISEQVKLENQEIGACSMSKYVPNSTWKAYYDKVKVYLPGVTSGNGVSMNTHVVPALANVIADGLSNSLTICYALANMKLKYCANGKQAGSSDPNVLPLANKDNIFTIHVIGAEEDWQGFAAFEEVLHRCQFNGKGADAILPSDCKGLRVIFIGPELKGAGRDTSGHREEFLCDHCKGKRMKLYMGFRNETYEDFVKNDLMEENCNLLPDVLVAFNCGIHDNSQVRQEVMTEQARRYVEDEGIESLKISYTSAWEKCIELICESPNSIFDNTPFILTGYDCRESREDQQVVCSFSKGGTSLIPIIEAEENPYQSPLWQSESAWFPSDDMPVVFGHNFALTALQRAKPPSK